MLQSTGLSKHEKKRLRGNIARVVRHTDPIEPVRQLLVSRKDAALMLGRVSVATIRRLEQSGVLKPIRLQPHAPSAEVFFGIDNVLAVARGEAGDDQ